MVRLSPCSSLFSSLCHSNIFINMTVIIPPMTKHARLYQNCLPKNIFFSFTRWYPRSFGNKRWTGRRRDGDRVVQVVVARRLQFQSRHSSWRFQKGKRVNFAESTQKNIFCVCCNERSKIEQRKQGWLSIFVEKNGPITAHFQSKKVGTLNCKRFPTVAFQRVCKIIKIVGKVFVCKRLSTNLWKDAS